MKSVRNSVPMKLALLVLFSVCQANAQFTVFEGKFTLQQETRWGQAVLPAGDYLVSLPTMGGDVVAMVQDARSRRTVARVALPSRGDINAGSSALLVGTRGTQQVIYSFRVAELGVVFVSDPALARAERVGEAHKPQLVPVVVAKK
jgi:hypothetical protein